MTFKQYITETGISTTGAVKQLARFGLHMGQIYKFGQNETIPNGFLEFVKTKPQKPNEPTPRPPAKKPTPKPPTLEPPTPPQTETKPQPVSKPWIDRSVLLLGINVLETVISIRGGHASYGWMGVVVVFAALLYYWFCILDAKDENSTTNRVLCLRVCFILSCLFAWFHFQAFNDYNSSVFHQNCCFAVIVSGLGFVAVLQTVPKK